MSDFRDFIPEGEDPGALGDGFKDFVPPKEPELQPEVEELKQEQAELKKVKK